MNSSQRPWLAVILAVFVASKVNGQTESHTSGILFENELNSTSSLNTTSLHTTAALSTDDVVSSTSNSSMQSVESSSFSNTMSSESPTVGIESNSSPSAELNSTLAVESNDTSSGSSTIESSTALSAESNSTLAAESNDTSSGSSTIESSTALSAESNSTLAAESNDTSNGSSTIEPSSQGVESSAASNVTSSESPTIESSSFGIESNSSFGLDQRTTLPENELATHSLVSEIENSTSIDATAAMLQLNITGSSLSPDMGATNSFMINGTEPTTTVGTTLGTTSPSDMEAINSSSTNISATATTGITSGPSGSTGAGRLEIGNKFNCSNLDPGYYGNPNQACDTKFYICVDPLLPGYEERCPGRLYYDSLTKQCDMWAHIPACSGKARPTSLSGNRSEIMPTAAPIVGCHNLTDGIYADPASTPKPFCSNRYFSCVGGREFRLNCPANLYFDLELHECGYFDDVFACSGNRYSNATEGTPEPHRTLPPVNFNCRGRKDGYYVEKCDSVYYSCSGGLAREFLCPDGLVFDSDLLSCEAPSDALICSGTRKPSTARPSTTTRRTVITTPSPLDCVGKADGIYRDPEEKCSRIFYYCAHNETIRSLCPGNLFYDDRVGRCDLWVNVFDCSGSNHTTTVKPSTAAPSALPVVDFDCTELDNGNYVDPNNSCSHFFYVCANMEAFKIECPSGLYYNSDVNNCDSWSNVFDCSGITKRTTIRAASPAILRATQKPEFDCSTRQDGTFLQNAGSCSNVYFRCVAGVAFKFNCPGGLYYDVNADLCDWRDNVFACSGRTHEPSTPSTTPHSTLPAASTAKSPMDCRSLSDGDYSDPSNSCSHIFYTCSAGYSIQRQCPAATYFDSVSKICDLFGNVQACSGRSRPTTVSGPSTTRTTVAPFPFDCTKLYDGNYPNAACSSEFWSCVGGLTFRRQCPTSFIYDDENDACEYSYLVPKCGGQRLTTVPSVRTSPTTPVGGFDCSFKIDGNYVDPAAPEGCSTIYYACANGMTTRVHCPAGLFYDDKEDTCNNHDDVPACAGVTISSNFTTPTTETSSIGAFVNNTEGTTFSILGVNSTGLFAGISSTGEITINATENLSLIGNGTVSGTGIITTEISSSNLTTETVLISNATLPEEAVQNTTGVNLNQTSTLEFVQNSTVAMNLNATSEATTSVSELFNTTADSGNTTIGLDGNTTIGLDGNTTIGLDGNTTIGLDGNTTIGLGGNTTIGLGGNTTVQFGNTTIEFGSTTAGTTLISEFNGSAATTNITFGLHLENTTSALENSTATFTPMNSTSEIGNGTETETAASTSIGLLGLGNGTSTMSSAINTTSEFENATSTFSFVVSTTGLTSPTEGSTFTFLAPIEGRLELLSSNATENFSEMGNGTTPMAL